MRPMHLRVLAAITVIIAVIGAVEAARLQSSQHAVHRFTGCGNDTEPRAATHHLSESVAAPAGGTGPNIASLGGIAAGYVLGCEADATLSSDLDAIAASGATWVRFDFDWSGAEPRRGSFDWRAIDRVVSGARRRQLNIAAMLGYTPAWARPSGTTNKTPPTDPRTYADFAAAVAARYGPQGVHAYEIWNEPNTSQFWSPRPNIRAYSKLLAGAAAAIRQLDSAATIVTAGLAPASDAADGRSVSPRTFLSGIYDAGARSSFDAVGIHPYDYPYGASAAGEWNQFWSLPQTYRIMVAHGDGAKKLWGTEYGAPTGTSSQAVSLLGQGNFVREGYDQWVAKPYAGPLFWYAHRDIRVDPSDPGANFGLMTNDFRPKPAFAVFRSVMAQPLPAGGATPAGPR